MLEINELSMDEFNAGIRQGVVLVDFNAPWCGPCRALEPVIHQLQEEYSQKAKIMQVNIDQAREVATRLNIQSIPTIVVFKEGEEQGRFVGLQSRVVLKGALDEALKAA